MDDRSDPFDEHTGEATVVEEDDLALEAYLEEGRLRRDALQALPYTEYLTTDHWRCTRERALRRAWRRCQMCNADADLHVHHNTYERRGREADRDLVVLCSRCHGDHHERMRLRTLPWLN